jgi:hypothetical protein
MFVIFAFREKHGLIRNDFLDCMMELRAAGKDEGQRDVQSAKKSNTGATFSKLQQYVIFVETRHWMEFILKSPSQTVLTLHSIFYYYPYKKGKSCSAYPAAEPSTVKSKK